MAKLGAILSDLQDRFWGDENNDYTEKDAAQAIEAIKALMLEVVGADSEYNDLSGTPDDWAITRNQLRAEQRKKIGEL